MNLGMGTVVLDEHVMDVISIRPTGGHFEIKAVARGPMKAFSGSGWALFGDDGKLVASNPNRRQRLDVPDLSAVDTITVTLNLNVDWVSEGVSQPPTRTSKV